VLREHTDLDEIMQKRFAQLGVKRRKLEADEEVSNKLMDEIREQESEVEEDDDEEDDGDDYEINKSGKKRRTKFSSDDDKSDKQELNAIFLRTQKEEEEGLAEVYPNLKRVLADPKYVAKSAVKMFRTRTHITDEEFEEILELCNVRVVICLSLCKCSMYFRTELSSRL
jgi:site-specific DNA-adenine methylase